MNFDQVSDLMAFAGRFLKEKGAVLETRGERIDALLPASLAKELDTEDYITLVPDSGTGEKPRERTLYPIHFGAPLLDRISDLAGDPPPLLDVSLKFSYMKNGGFDALVKEQFLFYKTTGSVSSFGRIKTRYILMTLKYLAQSDEQKEGLIDLAANLETCAVVPGMAQALSGVEKHYSKTTGLTFNKETRNRLTALVKQYGRKAVEQEIPEFNKSMNRRFARDSAGLDEYYTALAKEMEMSLSRAGISETLLAERMEKIAMISDELAVKKKDLSNKYKIRVTVSLAAAMAITSPAVRILYKVFRGRKKKNISLNYNPVSKSIDPVVCEGCNRSMYRIGMCKGLHLLCGQCQEKGCTLCR